MPENTRKADWTRAKAAAGRALGDSLVEAPPVRVDEIALDYGLRVSEGDFPAGVAGLIDMESLQIVVNKHDPVTRKVFTIAHELGHWIMHATVLESNPEKSVLLRTPLGRKNDDPLEQEANCFASHLLVPPAFLKKYAGHDIATLARIFGVSKEVISYALKR